MRSIILGLCLGSAGLFGQATGVQPQLLRTGVDTLHVFYIQSKDTARTGVVVDDIRIAKRAGRSVIERIYITQDRVLGTRVDTLVDDAGGLAPVSLRSRTSRNSAFLAFSRDSVIGWLRLANGDSVPVAAPLAIGGISSSAFDLWLRASPLSDSWSGTVQAFEPFSRTTIPLQARVTGKVIVDGEASWTVQANFGGTPVTFWIGQSSRTLRRQLMQIAPDRAILFSKSGPSVPRRAS